MTFLFPSCPIHHLLQQKVARTSLGIEQRQIQNQQNSQSAEEAKTQIFKAHRRVVKVMVVKKSVPLNCDRMKVFGLMWELKGAVSHREGTIATRARLPDRISGHCSFGLWRKWAPTRLHSVLRRFYFHFFKVLVPWALKTFYLVSLRILCDCTHCLRFWGAESKWKPSVAVKEGKDR